MGMGIGLLGAARITQTAIIEPANVMPQATLAAVAARDPARAQAYADRHSVRHAAASYQDVISATTVDLVYNPLPIHLHAEWSINALQAGKHVLCEKPFAMNADEAREMLATADRTGRRLIEAFHYRYHPAFQTCLDWLAADEIGELRDIHAAFDVHIKNDGHEIRHQVETGGGAMMDLGCYPLHWVLSILGEAPSEVQATATTTLAGVDESMQAKLSFASGVTTEISTSMAEGAAFRAVLKLIGSKGEIDFVNPLAPHIGAQLQTSSGRNAQISPISTYTWQLAAVLQALQTGASLPTEGDIILRQQAAPDRVYGAAGLRHLRFLSQES